MSVAYFRFYAELNDFLAPARRMVTFTHSFRGRVSIKDMIEGAQAFMEKRQPQWEPPGGAISSDDAVVAPVDRDLGAGRLRERR